MKKDESKDKKKNKQATQQERRLVSIERQYETDAFTGKETSRRFVKMYFEARDSGLLAALGDRNWRTLCVLATYIDGDGSCFPSQETIAKDLGVSRQMSNERIKALQAFRFHGQPVLTLFKERGDRGRWGRNSYRLHPIAAFEYGSSPAKARESKGLPTVSRKLDTVQGASTVSTTESRNTDTGKVDTNKNQSTNKKEHTQRVHPSIREELARNLVATFHGLMGRSKDRKPFQKELELAHRLISDYGEGRTHFLIDFAVKEAKKTEFNMQNLAAVQQYEAEAERAFIKSQQRHIRQQHEEKRQHEEDLHDSYYRWRDNTLNEIMDMMSEGDLDQIQETCRADLVAREGGDSRLGFETALRLSIREYIAAKKGISPFAKWRRDEYPKLRRNGMI